MKTDKSHLQHVEPLKPLPGLRGELSGVVDGAKQRQAVLEARHVVLLPVTRGGVHQPRTRLRGDVVAPDYHFRHAVAEGVLVPET